MNRSMRFPALGEKSYSEEAENGLVRYGRSMGVYRHAWRFLVDLLRLSKQLLRGIEFLQ